MKRSLNQLGEKRNGFTLAEMIAAISIIVIITGTSLTFFYQARNQKSVETVASDLRNKLLESHSDALAPKDDAINIEEVQILFDSANKKLNQRYKLSSGSSSNEEIYKFPGNVNVTLRIDGTPGNQINFEAGEGSSMGEVKNVSGNPYFELKNNDATITYHVIINRFTGDVEIKKI